MWDLGEEQGSRKEEKDLVEDREQERSKEEKGDQRVSEAGIEKGEEDQAPLEVLIDLILFLILNSLKALESQSRSLFRLFAFARSWSPDRERK